MLVSILSIGDEVVGGKVVNTNASEIAKILEANHFYVMQHLAVRDDKNEILTGLDYLYQNSNIVITVGGLGPTNDDLTKKLLVIIFKKSSNFFLRYIKKLSNIIQLLNAKCQKIIKNKLILLKVRL